MREARDIGRLLLGFTPWLLFLFLSGQSMQSLEVAIWLSLAASLTFGLSELRSRFILAWGTLGFFAACAVLVNGLHVAWVAIHMDVLANLSLAAIVWATLLAGRPFALQYARRDLPRERWNDPELIRGCRIITLVWALLMSLAAAVSLYKHTSAPQASRPAYFAISLALILIGVSFTTVFKRQKRIARERAEAERARAASQQGPAGGCLGS